MRRKLEERLKPPLELRHQRTEIRINAGLINVAKIFED
jgi:hypothetical protein